MGTLQKKVHITLTGIIFNITMDRNKRNSIAGFPTRPERNNEDRDGIGGVGVCEMGMGPPSQVSHSLFLCVGCISLVQTICNSVQTSVHVLNS